MFSEFQFLLAVFRDSVGLLFMYGGLTKLASLRPFVDALALIPYMPTEAPRYVGPLVAGIEVLVGIGLLLNSSSALWAATGMLFLFSAVAGLAIRRRQDIPCNCFGVDSSERLSWGTIVRNGAFLFVIALMIAMPSAETTLLVGTYALILSLLFLTALTAFKNHAAFVEAREQGAADL